MQLQLIIDFFKSLIRPTPSVAENLLAALVVEEEKAAVEPEPTPKKRTRRKKPEEA